MFKRIVVPLDGSGVAERAIEPARELARLYDVPMMVVRAVEPRILVGQAGPVGTGISTGTGMPGAMVGAYTGGGMEDDEAQAYIDRAAAHLRSQGFKATGIVVQGQPAHAVSETLTPTDLLVMSSHGRTGVARWFMGSVAEGILKRTSVPVLLIRE